MMPSEEAIFPDIPGKIITPTGLRRHSTHIRKMLEMQTLNTCEIAKQFGCCEDLVKEFIQTDFGQVFYKRFAERC